MRPLSFLVLCAIGACADLSATSPIPTVTNDLDAGFVPTVADDDGGGGGAVDAGPAPPSGRIRLANLIQNSGPVDLCAKGDFNGAQWQAQQVSKPGGLNYGEVSAHAFVSVPTSAGSRYQFRVVPYGSPCDGDAGGATQVSIAAGANTQLKQGGGLTIAAVGDANATPGTEAAPKGLVAADVLAPPAAFALLRVVHGVSDLAAFDVLVNGGTALQGVKYASAIGYPYSNNTGFANLAGGIPQGATITFQSGTTFRNFKVGDRVRRGVAETLFAAGRASGAPPVTVALCADREPPEGDVLSTCVNLEAEK